MKLLLIIIFISITSASCGFYSETKPNYHNRQMTISENKPIKGIGKCSENRKKARDSAVQDARIKYAHLKETHIRGGFKSYADSNGRVREKERYESRISPTSVRFSTLDFKVRKKESFLYDPRWCVIVMAIPY